MSQTGALPNVVKSTAIGNRRASIRYRCAPATIAKLNSDKDLETHLAILLDLSPNGVGLQVTRAIVCGLPVGILIKNTDGTKSLQLFGHVVHCTPMTHGEWSVGCRLTAALTWEELDQFL